MNFFHDKNEGIVYLCKITNLIKTVFRQYSVEERRNDRKSIDNQYFSLIG